MDKDLVVIVQSRSRPIGLYNVLKELYDKCNSLDNFDILCIIDNDEKDIYKNVKDNFSEVRWSIVPHIENSWFPILKAQYKFISKNNYYFNWVITDDTINISKNWDLEIISKKNMYQDNIFALFTQCDSFGRTPALHRICYDSHLEDKDNGDSIIRHNEMLPILTKDWVLSTWDIFKKGDFSSSRELITSSLLYKLKKTYDINRFIETTVYYSVLENLDTELKKGGVSGDIKNKNGVSRDKAFYTIAADNFTILVPTVNKLYKQINK